MLQVSFTGQFKKDFKLCKKRGYNMELLQSVMMYWQFLKHCQKSTKTII